mmetsp:Transcript_11534/g.34188  ORF Transcript_11534/g.34188 Transcript_11534/m.34188 type:complete len:266 (+) Transcript_11534:253-1050(+)
MSVLPWSNPVSPGGAAGVRLFDEAEPGRVVALDDARRRLRAVDPEVEPGFAGAAVPLEVVHPPQDLLDAPGRHALDLLHGARCGQRPLGPRVDDDDLPIGLLLVDEADCAQGPADDDLPDPGWLRRQIDHVQWVVVARRAVDVVGLEGVPERLREAAVVERHGLGEGPEPAGGLRVLADHVAGKLGLDLELPTGALRDLVDEAVGTVCLVEPVLHAQVYVVPRGNSLGSGSIRRAASHEDATSFAWSSPRLAPDRSADHAGEHHG